MSKSSQSAEVAVCSYSPFESPRLTRGKSKYTEVLFGMLAVIYDFFALLGTKLVNFSVIAGTVIHAKVVVPLTVYAVGLASLLYVLFDKARYAVRCGAHKVTVASKQLRRNRLALVSVLASLTMVVVASTFFSVGVKVFIDGEPVGYMNSQSDFNEAVTFVEKRASEILERPYSISSDVTFELGVVSREEVISKQQLQSIFFSDIEEVSMLYAITVDGQVVGASKNRETLQGMLDELLYVGDPNVKAEFQQDVQITQRYVDASYLLSYDEIRAKLTSKIHDARTYTIRSGDTVDKIAQENGITREDLVALNPGIKSSNLRAGRKVTIAKAVPFLSVKAIRHVTYTETIPFETKKVNSSELYKGKTAVSVQGKVGTRQVTADITYVDNKEVSREILESKVVREPVTQVVSVGTKARPSTAATGSLRRPVSGAIISSPYGYRRGKFHSGVDFALASGSRVSAADGGTVTHAGWKRGGWGYLVIINHGNGMETYYAHNSKVLVSVGQKVAKGEQIARVGSTGNSSGPHVHFEVHVNGRHVNPWKYMS